jgi:hypothetical protein
MKSSTQLPTRIEQTKPLISLPDLMEIRHQVAKELFAAAIFRFSRQCKLDSNSGTLPVRHSLRVRQGLTSRPFPANRENNREFQNSALSQIEITP